MLLANRWAMFTTAFIVGFSGAMMPGPLLTVTISAVARDGFWMGPLLIVGHMLAEILVVLALSAGLSRFLSRKWVAGGIGIGGGAFLLWMGATIALSAWQGAVALDFNPGQDGMGVAGPILTGAVVTILNPYWELWWATIGASYVISAAQGGFGALTTFFAGHILSDYTWYALIAFLVVTGSSLLSSTVYQGILLVCGLFLVGLSIYFLISGIKFIAESLRPAPLQG